MRTLIAVVLAAAVLMPAAAFAGSSADAALGLGAFAVFNQMLGGVGVFQRYQAPPPPVVIAPPPPPPVVYQYQYYAPAPVYAYPAPVYVVPGPAYYAPAPVVIYQQRGYHRGHHWRHGDDDD
jgi:hypothetical protein